MTRTGTLTAFHFLVVFVLQSMSSIHAQPGPDSLDALRARAPKVFLDCETCDQNFIRTEILFVNYVRDPDQADVHFLMTSQRTGSGGTEYTLTLIGRNTFAGMNDTLTYTAAQSETDAITRAGITRVLGGACSAMPFTPLSGITFR